MCKHMKNLISNQPCTSVNFCIEFSKAQVCFYDLTPKAILIPLKHTFELNY